MLLYPYQRMDIVMYAKKLKDFLDSHHVKYVYMEHSVAFTAPEVAEAAHVSGKEFAKTVIVKINGQFAMIVLPANRHIDFEKLRVAIGHDVVIAEEKEFKNKFPECETGAMPPFGNLYGMPVFVSTELSRHSHIVFNAGSHSELMQLAFQDFLRLAHPKVINI